MNDELALMDALHDLTTDQPAAPVDRFVGVRRRHVRRRVAMTSTAAVVAAVTALGALFAAGPLDANRATPANRQVPSWALPWSDHRDGSVSQRVLDQAVSAWRRIHADESVSLLPKPTQVTWYVGQRAVDDSEIVVMFEANSVEGHRLVAGFADADSVGGQFASGTSPWVLYDVPAPSPSYRGLIGLNVSHSGPVTPSTFHNWIVALARPSVKQIGWSGAGIAGGASGTDRGLVIADTGRPTGQVYATLAERTDQVGLAGPPLPVEVPGSAKSAAPLLRKPAALHGVPLSLSMGEATGQGSLLGSDMSFHHTGATTIYARCYGDGPIDVAVDRDTPGVGVSIPCDGRQHVVAGGRLRANGPFDKGHGYQVTASELTAWRVAVVAGHS